jgi:hypothetical protein
MGCGRHCLELRLGAPAERADFPAPVLGAGGRWGRARGYWSQVTAPDEAVERRLAELIAPTTSTLAEHDRDRGLRWRVLTLPVMVALVPALIWRQVPSLSTLVAMRVREALLWTRRGGSASRRSIRLLCREVGHDLGLAAVLGGSGLW